MGNSSTSFENDAANCLPSWAQQLTQALENEVLPRMLAARSADAIGPVPAKLSEFLDHLVADNIDQVRASAELMIIENGRDALLENLLAPAARLLGTLWEHDVIDFTTVTLGMYRLDQIMKETNYLTRLAPVRTGQDHRILLLPAPGEQHNFGLSMVADAFRDSGWQVCGGKAATRAQLTQLVRREWFDIIGFSLSTDRWLKGFAACLRALRAASCNPSVCIMLGGRAINNHPERTRFLGSDITARDGADAVTQCNNLLSSIVTQRLQSVKAKRVDAG